MTGDLFERDIVELARGHAKDFPQEFLDWLPENLTVWNAFVEQIFLVIKKASSIILQRQS